MTTLDSSLKRRKRLAGRLGADAQKRVREGFAERPAATANQSAHGLTVPTDDVVDSDDVDELVDGKAETLAHQLPAKTRSDMESEGHHPSEIDLLRSKLNEAKKTPFERYGREALDFYRGVEDEELRVSLMKLWCWGEEAKYLDVSIENIRINIVQVEKLANYVLNRFDYSQFSDIDGILRKCTGHEKLFTQYWLEFKQMNLWSLRLDSVVKRDKTAENSGISVQVKIALMFMLLRKVDEVVCCEKRIGALIEFRNTASHHSISKSSEIQAMYTGNSSIYYAGHRNITHALETSKTLLLDARDAVAYGFDFDLLRRR